MGFSAKVHPVALQPENIPPLLARTRELFDLARYPAGKPGCRNCEMVAGLLLAVTA
jgi:hypothetical protein